MKNAFRTFKACSATLLKSKIKWQDAGYTLCLYHGEGKWDGPRSLRDMVRFQEEEDPFESLFNDYPLRL